MSGEAKKLVNSFNEALTEESCTQFEKEGFCVVDLPASSTTLADPALWAKEIAKCYESKWMLPNKVQFTAAGQAKPICITKPNIFEADMHDQPTREKMVPFDELFKKEMSGLIKMLNDKVPLLQLAGAEDQIVAEKSITIKLQVNTGGAFPWHYDNPGPPNKRKLTLALYLQEDWEPSHSGEVVLLPFLGKEVVVPPKLGTLVLFRSDLIMHRVLPRNKNSGGANSYRKCFTIWFDAVEGAVNADEEVNLRAKQLQEDFIPALMTSPIQRSLSRAVYDEAYRTALFDCFGGKDTQESKISIAIHDAHLKPLQRSEATLKFIELVRSRRVQSEFK